MSARLAGANDREKLEALCRKTYKEQAIWFLNGFWEKLGAEKEALVIYEYVKKCHSLDLDKKAEGNELDELQAHRFLESFQKTLTVQSMRDQLRKTGAIGDKIKNVPLSHLLLVLYNVHFKDLINASQGNQDEIEKAQKLLEAVNTALRESEAKAEAARQALKEAENREAAARASEEQAKQREVEAKQREAEALVAKQELEAALAELKAQEDAYNNKTEDLKRKSEEGTVVQKNKAKNELAQHLAEDPLPLRRAKINQEAAVRKAEKTAKAAAEARAASEQARKDAEKARDAAVAARTAAEKAVDAADAAVEEARSRVAEAEAYLEEAKSKPGGQGSLWWIGQELHEAKAYLPASKGGYAKKKVF